MQIVQVQLLQSPSANSLSSFPSSFLHKEIWLFTSYVPMTTKICKSAHLQSSLKWRRISVAALYCFCERNDWLRWAALIGGSPSGRKKMRTETQNLRTRCGRKCPSDRIEEKLDNNKKECNTFFGGNFVWKWPNLSVFRMHGYSFTTISRRKVNQFMPAHGALHHQPL